MRWVPAFLVVLFAAAMAAAGADVAPQSNDEPAAQTFPLSSPASVPAAAPPSQTFPLSPPASAVSPAEPPTSDAALDRQMEDIKRSLVELKRDLVVLEEDLLFPASSQVAVFLSMDVGEFFALDSVTVKLNGKEVTHYLYTERQVDALYRGGVQRLYVGNARQGSNELTAFFTGRGPAGRDYRRATTVSFEKSFEPTFVELKITDSTAKYQPEFVASVSP